jgi:hypothetical protein
VGVGGIQSDALLRSTIRIPGLWLPGVPLFPPTPAGGMRPDGSLLAKVDYLPCSELLLPAFAEIFRGCLLMLPIHPRTAGQLNSS